MMIRLGSKWVRLMCQQKLELYLRPTLLQHPPLDVTPTWLMFSPLHHKTHKTWRMKLRQYWNKTEEEADQGCSDTKGRETPEADCWQAHACLGSRGLHIRFKYVSKNHKKIREVCITHIYNLVLLLYMYSTMSLSSRSQESCCYHLFPFRFTCHSFHRTGF